MTCSGVHSTSAIPSSVSSGWCSWRYASGMKSHTPPHVPSLWYRCGGGRRRQRRWGESAQVWVWCCALGLLCVQRRVGWLQRGGPQLAGADGRSQADASPLSVGRYTRQHSRRWRRGSSPPPPCTRLQGRKDGAQSETSSATQSTQPQPTPTLGNAPCRLAARACGQAGQHPPATLLHTTTTGSRAHTHTHTTASITHQGHPRRGGPSSRQPGQTRRRCRRPWRHSQTPGRTRPAAQPITHQADTATALQQKMSRGVPSAPCDHAADRAHSPSTHAPSHLLFEKQVLLQPGVLPDQARPRNLRCAAEAEGSGARRASVGQQEGGQAGCRAWACRHRGVLTDGSGLPSSSLL